MSSKVEMVILGLLAEGPLYGYELLERYRRRSMEEWVDVARASVYQALRRLEERRAVTGVQQDGSEGPDRRVYRIVRGGRERLRRSLREALATGGPHRSDAGPALGFVHLLGAGDADRALAEREGAVRARREHLAEGRLALDRSGDLGDAVAARLLELQDALAGAELQWLGSFRRDLGRLRS